MQTFLYLVSNDYVTTSNAFFFNLDDAKKFILNELKTLNQGINENDPYFCNLNSFRIFKVNIGQRFDADIEQGDLEKIELNMEDM